MRNFSWNYFVMTGDVDAYMLYKEVAEDADYDLSRDAGDDLDEE